MTLYFMKEENTLIYISLGKKKNTLIEINNKMKSALNQNLEVLVKY